jgi:histidine triad (HIT) family protein
VYEDDYVYAFRDIAPQMPVHVLVIPKLHLASADEVSEVNSVYVSKIFEVIPKIAAAEGLTGGYRIISNCGDDACQSVKHLHFHILGGGQMSEKMA